jgi:hypothetical protein
MLTKFIHDTTDPKRPIDRSDKDEAKLKKSITDIVPVPANSFAPDRTEQPDPSRVKFLTDTELPIWANWSTETADPSLPKLRKDRDDASVNVATTDSFAQLPKAVQPWTESLSPRRTKCRTDMELPT